MGCLVAHIVYRCTRTHQHWYRGGGQREELFVDGVVGCSYIVSTPMKSKVRRSSLSPGYLFMGHSILYSYAYCTGVPVHTLVVGR
jgi:hypothetical protein